MVVLHPPIQRMSCPFTAMIFLNNLTKTYKWCKFCINCAFEYFSFPRLGTMRAIAAVHYGFQPSEMVSIPNEEHSHNKSSVGPDARAPNWSSSRQFFSFLFYLFHIKQLLQHSEFLIQSCICSNAHYLYCLILFQQS